MSTDSGGRDRPFSGRPVALNVNLLEDQRGGDEFIPNHSPKFHIDESSILVGVRTLGHLTLDYMVGAQAAK